MSYQILIRTYAEIPGYVGVWLTGGDPASPVHLYGAMPHAAAEALAAVLGLPVERQHRPSVAEPAALLVPPAGWGE